MDTKFEFKGTPGPWERYSKSEIVSAVYAGVKLIHISGKNNEESKANAQLISKATEMFKMLNRLISAIDQVELSAEAEEILAPIVAETEQLLQESVNL